MLVCLVGYCPFVGVAQSWLSPSFQKFFVSPLAAATVDAPCAAWYPGKMEIDLVCVALLLCVQSFRILEEHQGDVKDKESDAGATKTSESSLFAVSHAIVGREIQAAAASASVFVFFSAPVQPRCRQLRSSAQSPPGFEGRLGFIGRIV